MLILFLLKAFFAKRVSLAQTLKDKKVEITENYISLLKGFWFIFEHENHEIKVGGSAISGKEWVYVDGELQSETRNLKKESIHKININGEELSIVFLVTSIIKGDLEVSLIYKKKIIKKYKTVYTGKFFSKKLLVALGLSVSFGLISGWYSWPEWILAPFLLATFGIFFLINKKNIKVTEVHV